MRPLLTVQIISNDSLREAPGKPHDALGWGSAVSRDRREGRSLSHPVYSLGPLDCLDNRHGDNHHGTDVHGDNRHGDHCSLGLPPHCYHIHHLHD